MPEWLIDFFLNLCGYAVVLIPGSFLVYASKNLIRLDKLEDGLLKELIVKFAYGSSACEQNEEKQIFRVTRKNDVFALIICIIGLLSSYLLWGVVQERIVSVPYKSSDNTEVHFKDSLFLEFSNRIFSLLAAVAVLIFTKQPEHMTPIYKYSYNSFTCLMSSWCQYEALKYVTFPVQVLVKASKVIPVMAMGWLVSGRTYNLVEYFNAFLMSLGYVDKNRCCKISHASGEHVIVKLFISWVKNSTSILVKKC